MCVGGGVGGESEHNEEETKRKRGRESRRDA